MDHGDDVTAALDEIRPVQTEINSDAVAGGVWTLCHILGLRPEEVNRLTVDPHAGVVTAEVWTGRADPAPWGPPGSLRPNIEVRRFTYRTPEVIALEIVTQAAG